MTIDIKNLTVRMPGTSAATAERLVHAALEQVAGNLGRPRASGSEEQLSIRVTVPRGASEAERIAQIATALREKLARGEA
ncbi:MAG: hypothetical protein AAGF12_16540 [Myxococcota bacterium]